MSTLRRTFLVALLAGGTLLVAAVPSGAGVNFVITGTTTCDPATATTTIHWNIQADAPVNVVATQTPPGQTLTVTPNPVQIGSNSATGTVPGTTVGVVTLSVTVVGGLSMSGTVDVPACVAPPAAAVPAAAAFTG